MTPSSNRSADIRRRSASCGPGSPSRTSPVSISTRSRLFLQCDILTKHTKQSVPETASTKNVFIFSAAIEGIPSSSSQSSTARGLLLIDFILLETDLKIKGERGQDKQLSKGLLQIDGRRLTWENIEAVTCDSRLSTVEVKYAVVKDAVEATVEIQVPHVKSQLTPPASFVELSYMIAKLLVRQPLVVSNFGAVP